MGLLTLLLCLCLCLMPCTAIAASTGDARELISTDRDCTLTLCYSYDGKSFPNQTVKLYKIADASENCQYTLTSLFSSTGLTINGIQTNGEWNVVRETLDAHIFASQITPASTATTDAQGQALFTRLKPGLYLASAVSVAQDGLTCVFDSALIALPALGTDGLWQYQVTASAKPEVLPPIEPDGELQFKVLKLWKGDEGNTGRPRSIEVEIFRNDTSYKTVTLSADNQWCYSWTADNDGASWHVTERNIPDGYTMTVEKRGTTFVVTNAITPDNPDKPLPPPAKTGDSSNILLYITLMYVSGILLVMLGITGKRKRYDKKN